MEGLTTGRMVHVNDASGSCMAGVVTAVYDGDADHPVINVGGWRSLGTPASWQGVPFDPDQGKSFGWHWVEKA